MKIVFVEGVVSEKRLLYPFWHYDVLWGGLMSVISSISGPSFIYVKTIQKQNSVWNPGVINYALLTAWHFDDHLFPPKFHKLMERIFIIIIIS